MIEVQMEREERVKRHVVSVADSNPKAAVQPRTAEKDHTGLPALIFFYCAVFGLSAWNAIRVVWFIVSK